MMSCHAPEQIALVGLVFHYASGILYESVN